ncbi:hypothetical protein EV126DRAFT_437588, partial [Verticillium dahliae]
LVPSVRGGKERRDHAGVTPTPISQPIEDDPPLASSVPSISPNKPSSASLESLRHRPFPCGGDDTVGRAKSHPSLQTTSTIITSTLEAPPSPSSASPPIEAIPDPASSLVPSNSEEVRLPSMFSTISVPASLLDPKPSPTSAPPPVDSTTSTVSLASSAVSAPSASSAPFASSAAPSSSPDNGVSTPSPILSTITDVASTAAPSHPSRLPGPLRRWSQRHPLRPLSRSDRPQQRHLSQQSSTVAAEPGPLYRSSPAPEPSSPPLKHQLLPQRLQLLNPPVSPLSTLVLPQRAGGSAPAVSHRLRAHQSSPRRRLSSRLPATPDASVPTNNGPPPDSTPPPVGQAACVEGGIGFCNTQGSFDIRPCTAPLTSCFPLPLENAPGVMVDCYETSKAREILGLSDAPEETPAPVASASSRRPPAAPQEPSDAPLEPSASPPAASDGNVVTEIVTPTVTKIIATETVPNPGQAVTPPVSAAPEETTTTVRGTVVSTVFVTVDPPAEPAPETTQLVTVTVTASLLLPTPSAEVPAPEQPVPSSAPEESPSPEPTPSSSSSSTFTTLDIIFVPTTFLTTTIMASGVAINPSPTPSATLEAVTTVADEAPPPVTVTETLVLTVTERERIIERETITVTATVGGSA